MTKKDIDIIVKILCPNDEDFEKPIISPKYLKQELEQLALEQEPSVTSKQKTGKWVKYAIPRCGEQHYKCTNCDDYINFGQYGDYYTKDFKFCPHCGAKMEEESATKEKQIERKCKNCKYHDGHGGCLDSGALCRYIPKQRSEDKNAK